ncbi:MAG: molybdate ABC transporter substrate-binding protein [Campylobacterales bacterium]|nr:molybdate ABC transporter substrate-binding protein [Campylobacterales bacterium]
MKKLLLSLLFLAANLYAGEIKIAVAANVTAAMEALQQEFAKTHPDTKVTVLLGSSGKLTAQIANGAPFDVFMSADMTFPHSLYEKKIAMNEPQVYAQGALALFSIKGFDLSKGISVVTDAGINKIAIANPKSAPYGKAAIEALTKTGLLEKVEGKFVYGESITQAVQYTITAAEIGFVAKSSMKSKDMIKYEEGKAYVDVDPSLYTPIDQGVVMLKHGENNSEAKAFYDFIMSKEAKAIFKAYGYLVHE